jgi:hypothetical protein
MHHCICKRAVVGKNKSTFGNSVKSADRIDALFNVFNKLKNVLRDVIADSETILITPEYVNEEFYDVMQEFKEDYKNLCDICVGEFNAIVNDCATKYKTVLVEYFYDIIPEEAFEMLG